MSKIISYLIMVTLILFSASVLADRIVVSGQPVSLEQRGETYYYPANTAAPSGDYRYVTVGNNNNVCYMQDNPAIGVNSSLLNVDVGGATQSWHCYPAADTYFDIR